MSLTKRFYDLYKQELHVGDIVAFNHASSNGRGALDVGEIVAFTPRMVKIRHKDRMYSLSANMRESTRDSNNLVKIDAAKDQQELESLRKENLVLKFRVQELEKQLK